MNTHTLSTRLAFLLAAMLMAARAFAADSNPFIGHWALALPDNGAGWLGVVEQDGKLSASILWYAGSVVPTESAKLDGDTLIITRLHRSDNKRSADGKTTKVVTTETITARVQGDVLTATTVKANADQPELDKKTFTGKRTPPLPAAPDLSKVKFGEPIKLIGNSLQGWKLIEQGAANGWSVADGVLINTVVQEPGKYKEYGNLRTEKEFEDFNITTEVNVPKGGNSGIYLRGIYEIQIFDSYGRPTDSHNMGAVYSRIKPTQAAEKPAGEWQTIDITLVDRHVTVILNGKKIIDNQPVLGCTGGALWSDPLRPGPIYLQGDHTGISYRNMILKPVVK